MRFTLSLVKIACITWLLWLSYCCNASGATGKSIKSGSWTTANTWLIGGANRIPTCGDTVTISKYDTVTVNTQIDLAGCGSPLYIIVDTNAVYQFTNGNKIDLPCGSTVEVLHNGVLKKSTAGGGNSTLISICDTVEWKAGDGTITGYIKFHAGEPLPVTWLGMRAELNGDAVYIHWSTALEINNNYFTVEKTRDGKSFTPVGEMAGAGNSSSVHNYRMVDHTPYPGISYYRVKQTDFDGQASYSRLAAVNYKGKKEILFFPNPVKDQLYIAVPPAEENTYAVHVYDAKGSTVLIPAVTDFNRSNIINVDFSTLSAGLYTVQVVSDFDIVHAKLVKE